MQQGASRILTCSMPSASSAGLVRPEWPVAQPAAHESVSLGCSHAISSVPKNMSGRIASLLCRTSASRLVASRSDITWACGSWRRPVCQSNMRYTWHPHRFFARGASGLPPSLTTMVQTMETTAFVA